MLGQNDTERKKCQNEGRIALLTMLQPQTLNLSFWIFTQFAQMIKYDFNSFLQLEF